MRPGAAYQSQPSVQLPQAQRSQPERLYGGSQESKNTPSTGQKPGEGGDGDQENRQQPGNPVEKRSRARLPLQLRKAPSENMKLAHFSDTHIGYRAYEALTPRGNNQREADIVSAFRLTVASINEWEPDLVIHAGDVADAPRLDHRLMLVAKRELTKLTAGGERPVVVIAGNHDAPRSRRDVCFLELFADIPGLHIVTQGYEQINLGDTVIHALPHDTLKSVDMDEVRPVRGKTNILTSHGVAESTELFLRAVGREFPIKAEVMLRDWEYIALGHWHKRGPVHLGGEHGPGARNTSRIWYAGSTENISFRDLRDDNGMRRGWLAVDIGSDIAVDERDIDIRPMFRLPSLDGEGMGPEEITAELLRRLDSSRIRNAVVGQEITGVSRDIWSLVDHVSVRAAARDALHYQITLRPLRAEARVTTDDGEKSGAGLGQIDEVVGQIIAKKASAEEAETVAAVVATFLKDALGEEHAGNETAADTGEAATTEAEEEYEAEEAPSVEEEPSVEEAGSSEEVEAVERPEGEEAA